MSGLPGAISTKQTDPPSFFSCHYLTLSLSREPLLYPCHALVGLALDLCRWPQLRWTCAGDLRCCHTHATPEVGISPLPPPPANSCILSAGPSTARYSELWSSALWPLTNLHFSRHPLQKQTNKQKPPVNKQDLLRPKLRAMKICTCKHTCLECTLTAWLFSEIMTVFHTSTPSQGLCFA